MPTRACWLLALGVIGSGTPQGLGDPPPATPVWRNPAAEVWVTGTQAEIAGCRWAFFQTDETYFTWFLRAGSSELKAGVRGDFYLGSGWRINADFGADLFTGLTATGRVEWHPLEGVMLATQWDAKGVHVAWWEGYDWDLSWP